jgi:aspartate carbamoyltransferase catalytic subunit
VSATHDLDAAIKSADVVYVLRIQAERMREALVPTMREYTSCWGITSERARLLRKGAVVLHPGPMNRGVEICAEVADSASSLITRQVRHGISVRMAVLFSLLSGAEGVAVATAGGEG